jgi:transposase InsO family protein
VSSNSFDCISCQLRKQPVLPFNNSESHATASFDLIHSDVWGPSPVASMNGSCYFVIFVDDFSRYTWIFLMKSRSELLDIYCNFAKMVETQFSKRIKAFCSDNALEYTQHDFQSILKHYGTVFHLSCLGTSQQNGRAERKLRHILDTVRALLLSTSLPTHFGVKLLSRLSTQSIDCLPLSLIIALLTRGCLALSPHIIIFVFLAQHVLFYSNLMSAPNSSLVLGCVAFLGMEWNKKVTDAMILSLLVFASLVLARNLLRLQGPWMT